VSRPELIGPDHKYCNAYERHGLHASAMDAALRGSPGSHAPEGSRTPRSVGKERVRITERAQANVCHGPRPNAVNGEQALATASRSAPA